MIAFFWISLLGCASPGRELSDHQQYIYSRSSETQSSVAGTDVKSPVRLRENSTLSDYLTYAALNNPGLEAAFNRWKAAIERVPQVRSLPDPRFTYRYYIEEVETRVGAQEQGFGIAQTFPWFGKLSLRADAAAQAAKAKQQLYEATKLKLFYQVKDAYYEYYYLWRAIARIEENFQLVKQFESVARIRYKVAAGGHPDVIRAQVELGKLADRLGSLKDLQGPIVARLNAALNRPAGAELPWPRAVVEESISLTDEQMLDWMARSNPELGALEQEIARSRTKIRLAEKDYYPDITLGLNYVDTAKSIGGMNPSDDGKDPLIAMVSINLPIWRSKLAARVREARHRNRAAALNKSDKENSLSAELKLALYRFRDASRKIDLFRDTLLPKAKESLRVNMASFRAGKGGFLDFIDAQRMLLQFELDYERGLANQGQQLAKLEMLIGEEIPRAGNSVMAKPVVTDVTGDEQTKESDHE